MTFDVTYREKSGAKAEAVIEAASRAECVAECRRRGIAPVGIREGKGRDGSRLSRVGANGQDARSPSQRAGRPLSQWLVVGVLIAAAIAGGVWWWMGRGGRDEARPSLKRQDAASPSEAEKRRDAASPKDGAVGASRPTNAVGAAAVDSRPESKAAATNGVPEGARETYLGKEVVSHTYVTNATGRSVREVIVTADGKRHGRTTVIAKPTFKYGTDQMLADVLFPPEHGQTPPWPEMDAKALDREFAQSILDPIAIRDDDPEDVRLRKEAVKQARSEMVQLLKDGHSVLEVLQKQREGNEHAHEMQLTVARELQRMRREGASQDAVRDYLDKANNVLEQSGVGPVAEPERKGRRQ